MHRPHSHWTPRPDTCIDQVAGRSASTRPHPTQVAAGDSPAVTLASRRTPTSRRTLTSRRTPTLRHPAPTTGPAYRAVMTAPFDVPDVGPDAGPDPHFAQLRGEWSLPMAYLPPAMAARTSRPAWMKLAAWGLIALFLTATTGGICLTYGPGS